MITQQEEIQRTEHDLARKAMDIDEILEASL